jgi:hypothetical protein
MMGAMGLDLAATWMLSFFGACFAGMALGFVVGRFTRFEIGLGVGLLLAGVTSLSFTPRFVLAYRELTTSAWRSEGSVVAIEPRPVNAAGDVTTPVAVVEFEASGAMYRAESRGGTALHVGDRVAVVWPDGDPRRAKFGDPHESLGGAIASLLFGIFPFSAALFFLITAALPERAPDRRATARAERQERSYATWLANLVMFAGMTSIFVTQGTVLDQIVVAFGGVSLGLWLHVANGIRLRADPRWTLGMSVVAINFSVWVAVLWLLTRTDAPFR